jgi:hypothetical protein
MCPVFFRRRLISLIELLLLDLLLAVSQASYQNGEGTWSGTWLVALKGLHEMENMSEALQDDATEPSLTVSTNCRLQYLSTYNA